MKETGKETPTILAVDDNADALYALERVLVHNGYRVATAKSGSEALDKVEKSSPDLILLDVMLPGLSGLEVCEKLKSHPQYRFIPVILVTARDALDDVIAGFERGADDYISKPFKPEELLARLQAALRTREIYAELKDSEELKEKLLTQISSEYDFDNIVGKSAAMRPVFLMLEKVVKADSPVLIVGPSGTGKELVAKAIHYNSDRKAQPFIAKNCAAFNQNLLESELFGHKKGAFTGAHEDKIGLFEAAHRGTLFLDEVAEMSQELQAKFLRVLQEGKFMPVGSTKEVAVDVRVVAATNKILEKAVEAGDFREDLYYRLNVVSIDLPPLAERAEDIELLVEHFLKRAADRRNLKKKEVTREVLDLFRAYSWKGNVRELENEIERMLILGGDAELLDETLVSPKIAEKGIIETNGVSGSLKKAVGELEKKMILDALQRHGGNKSSAAKELGISRSNLISKTQLYDENG